MDTSIEAVGENLDLSILSSLLEISKFNLEIKRFILFKLDISWAEFKELGNDKISFPFRFSIFGALSLVTLSKFDIEDKSSVFALIKFAFAPARDDSDWAKSVRLTSPFCTLALSYSTCLSNKFTFEILTLSFLVL